VSPPSKRDLACRHLETAREDVDGGRHADAINALFYAAEAAAVWLADRHDLPTEQKHWLKATAATTLHHRGVAREDFGELLRRLNQRRKDYWYDGEEINAADVEALLPQVETLGEDAERVE
jgi:hypothetical protein